MKNLILTFLLSFSLFQAFSNINIDATPTGYVPCPSTIFGSCTNSNYLGNTVQTRYLSIINDTDIEFRVRKCDGSSFGSSGTVFVKEGGVCGNVINSVTYSSGTSGVFITVPLDYWIAGSKDFTFTITSSSTEHFNAGTINILKECPDFQVSNVQTEEVQVYQGQQNVDVSCLIENIGNVQESNDVYFYLSTNTTYSSNDYYIGKNGFNLAGGSSETTVEDLDVEPDQNPGGYYVVAIADRDDNEEECQEWNNASFTYIQVNASPDYTITAVIIDEGQVCQNGSFDVTYTIQNIGDADSDLVRIGFFLSSNQSLGSSDIELNYDIAWNLDAGDSQTITHSLNVGSTPIENYYVIVFADDVETQIEQYENNNILASSTEVDILGAPTLLNPADNSTTTNNTPFLDWSSVSNANEYAVVVRDLNDNIIVGENTGSISEYTIPNNTLNPNQTYKWFAGVELTGGEICASEEWEFSTPIVNAIEVTNPISSSTFTSGDNLPINWTIEGTVNDLSFELRDAVNGFVTVIAEDVSSNQGSITDYNLPICQVTGQYKIKVYETNTSNPIEAESALFTINQANGCTCTITNPSLANGDPQELVDAANYLCNEGIISENGGDTNPELLITRAELAKIVFIALFGNQDLQPSDNFPSPFLDLQNTNAWFYRFAKCLSYLEYGDGASPFNRNSDFLFKPYDPISRANTLKVILEAFNITEDGLNFNPFSDVNSGTDSYSHIVTAYDLCLINENSGTFNPNNDITRGDVFLIMHRLLDFDCATNNYTIPVPTIDDYFCPGNQSTFNMAREIGVSEGNFNHYGHTSFALDGIGLSLDFTHEYNSYLTDLPDGFFPVRPLGYGWTHTYNSYIIPTSVWDEDAQDSDEKLVLFFPSGQLEVWDDLEGTYPYTCTSDTKGVYETLTVVSASLIEVRTKNQITYTYTKMSSGVGEEAYFITKIVDRNNHTIDIEYEVGNGVGSPHRIDKVIRQLGNSKTSERTLYFTYSSGTNYINSVYVDIPNIGGTSISFSVNNDDDLKTFTDRAGSVSTYNYINDIDNPTPTEYDQQKHLLFNVLLPKGNTITNIYQKRKLNSSNLNNKLITNVDLSLNYDNNALGISSDVTTYNAGNSNNPTYKENIEFDENNHGVVKCMTINGDSQCLEYNDPLHPFHPTKIFDANAGLDIYYFYDNVANLERKEYWLGTGETYVHQFEYTTYNDISKYIDPSFNEIVYNYGSDADKGLVASITDQENNMTQFTYYYSSGGQWKAGAIKSNISPENIQVDYSYDLYGNPNGIDAPSNISSSSEYDPLGRVIEHTTPNGHVYGYTYYNNDLPHIITNPESNTVIYGYDENYNLRTIKNERGQTTTLEYKYDTDLLESVEFGGNEIEYDYYSDGRVDEITKPDGTVVDISYINSGFGLGQVQNDGFATYTYDNENRVQTITRNNGASQNTLTYNYDGLNRVVEVIYDQTGSNSINYSIKYEYDVKGNIIKIRYPNLSGSGYLDVSYDYYDNNWLKEVEDWESKKTTFYYHNDGLLDYIDHPNGTKCSYVYNATNRRLEGMTETKSNGDIIAQYSYVLDEVGNIINETRIDPLSNARYESELTTITYHPNNFVNEVNGVQYNFNANGNLTNDGENTYQWNNSYDLLTSVNNTDFKYKYDGQGARREKEVNGQYTQYIVDPMGITNVIATKAEVSNEITYFIYAGSTLLYRKKKAGSGYNDGQFHYNYQGSTVALTDASENITHKYAYRPYGAILEMEEADVNEFRFNGKFGVIADTDDFYYMRARYYDGYLGRFISQDPIWSTNLFAFGGGNPNMKIDPRGLSPEEVNQCYDVPAVNVCSYNDMTLLFTEDINQSKLFFARKSEEFDTKLKVSEITSANPITRIYSVYNLVDQNIKKAKRFKDLNTDGAEYDIKNSSYDPDFIGETSTLNGQKMRYDDYGNIMYGANGREYGYSLWFLKAGAGANQIFKKGGKPDWTNYSGFFDHRRDTQMIKKGFYNY